MANPGEWNLVELDLDSSWVRVGPSQIEWN